MNWAFWLGGSKLKSNFYDQANMYLLVKLLKFVIAVEDLDKIHYKLKQGVWKMDAKKIAMFMQLAGQQVSEGLSLGDEEKRKLGAQLLLSEALEYVIQGLGVCPEVKGVLIEDPDDLVYHCCKDPDVIEMLDGLSDVAYTMYWNALAFGLPLEEGFRVVCLNNLEKFVALPHWAEGEMDLAKDLWDCGLNISWPEEVRSVTVQFIEGKYFAVGKDERGKVRKPSSFQTVDLRSLVQSQ